MGAKGDVFARRVFLGAGLYGLVILLPQYFLEQHISRMSPVPISHPEQFYGFIGLALVWQLAFLLIAHDPARYRPLMVVALLEKLAFAVPATVLFAAGRVDVPVLALGGVDLALGALFAAAWWRTRPVALPDGAALS